MIDFILQSKIKYFVLVVLGVVFLVFILHHRNKTSEEDEIRNFHEEIAIRETASKLRQKAQQAQLDKHKSKDSPPADWNVQFYSGKQMANEVDSEKQLFQIHTVIVENIANLDVDVECRDVFSKFGAKLTPGSQYKFQVTDLFHKRHYWCEAVFDLTSGSKPKLGRFNRHRLIDLEDGAGGSVTDTKKSYLFRAYGEGAPRDNNHISLKLDGAFINGENMVFTNDN